MSSDLTDALPGDNLATAIITCHPDNDRDGMRDDWEAAYGLSSVNPLIIGSR